MSQNIMTTIVACQQKLNLKYENSVNSIKIRSKCNWYETSKKISKSFLNVEKMHYPRSGMIY